MSKISLKYRSAICIPVFLFICQLGFAQENANALSWRMNTAYNAYLMREVHKQYEKRNQDFAAALSSKKAMEKYRELCKEKYRKIIGEFSEKSNLNTNVVGKKSYDGFEVEQIIFESVPGRFVTANLYLPKGKGPFPTVLVLAGHGMSGKVSEQKEALLLVKNGIAAFAVDPIGQGERVQFLDDQGKSATRGSTTEHTLLNAGANLVGTSLAAQEYWDNHRALDYLETRPEVDKQKLGCIGSSGGGTQNTYMLGLDERIKVAVVCSYVSKRERVLELNGPSDGCQHIPYEGREGLEIGDFLLMFSPKPLLIMSGLYDFVDYWGAQKTYEDLKNAYAVLDKKQDVSWFTIEGGHGMPKPKREAAASWFRHYFYNDNTHVKETETAPIPEKELLTTSTGQVLKAFGNGISLPQENLKISDRYASQRSAFVKGDSIKVKAKVLELLGINVPEQKISFEVTGVFRARNHDVYKYQINRAGEMPVPVLVIHPETTFAESKVVLLLNDNGKSEIIGSEKNIESYLNRGDILVLADLRGFGETADPLELNDTKYWNSEYRNSMISMHIGKPVMGQRVTDIFSILDFISGDSKLKNRKISLLANGRYGPVAIHAAYLDKRISQTEISGSVKSFEDYLKNPVQRDVYTNVLYGVLQSYDLMDLVGISGKGRIRFTD